ncbi:2-iminoacetate synthase (ThiH) [hydrothermal vent metagenome]|uniref:2-iminoacetate synthase (ThiH) n=1 Tax=hydrothermal vent metagenome TaxID=652676 RepID=A0A3B1D3I4_9ZZZZ
MLTLAKIQNILNDSSPETTEQLAQQAAQITQQYFGRTISLYAPIYLSNYCSSHCTYCGFNSHNRIQRIKLTPEQIQNEMQYIANTGIKNILLLTGESYKATPVSYLKEAVKIAKQYFTGISLEVHPMDMEEYHELFLEGVDGITIYQETYDCKRYAEVHISGKKSDFPYRFETPARIAQSGIRHISMGILLGLADPAEDLYALYEHIHFMEKYYPGVEYSLSFPRLRTIKGETFAVCPIDDMNFIKIICLTRILFPRIGINLSTRETAYIRDNVLGLGITKISAGSNTAVGGYVEKSADEQDPQFDIEDLRSVDEMIQLLKQKNFDPVFTDWRPIKNT